VNALDVFVVLVNVITYQKVNYFKLGHKKLRYKGYFINLFDNDY
jgi:hypothetical protein